jgi:hypothetical protein
MSATPSNRAQLWIGVLAGGWLATLALLLVPGLTGGSGLRPALAEDPPIGGGAGQQPNPNGPRTAGPTVNPLDAYQGPRAAPNPGGGTSDSNNAAIALSASLGGGQSAVWYFDTQRPRVLVYAFETGSKGGLRLLAARHIDMDLKLEAYNDVSDKRRSELKEDYDKAFAADAAASAKPSGGLPTKNVQVPGGTK